MFDSLSGGMDAIKNAAGTFGKITESLGGVTDEASAEAAAPQLEEATNELDGLAGKFSALPGPIKSQLTGKIGEYTEQFEELANKVTSIPGVGGILGPHVDKIRGIISSLG